MIDFRNVQNFDALGTVQNSFLRGRQLKKENDTRSALSAYAKDPNEENFGVLADAAPDYAIKVQGRREKQRAEAGKDRREQMMQLSQLLDDAEDEESYQSGLAAAQQLGLDISSVPQQYDPQFVNQQRLLVNAFIDKEDDLPGIAEELKAAGYEPGSPEFQEGLIGIINNKYATDYVDENGNTRRRSALNIGGRQNKPVSPPDAAIADLKANPDSAAQFDEIFGEGAADSVLGGGSSNATGNFQP